MSADERLAGGLGNEGRVVRRGATVRRPAGPVDRLGDIAIAMRHWVPMRDPDDLDEHRRGVDIFGRFGLFAETHRLDGAERSRVLDAVVTFLDSALVSVRAQAEAGHTGHLAQWNAGYEGTNRRARHWVAEQRSGLLST